MPALPASCDSNGEENMGFYNLIVKISDIEDLESPDMISPISTSSSEDEDYELSRPSNTTK